MTWHELFGRPAKSPLIDIDLARDTLHRLEILTEEINAKEKDVQVREKLLRTLADDLEAPIWGKDTRGCFVFLNTACAKKILHSSVEEALSRTDEDFEHDALAQVCMNTDKIVELSLKTRRFIEHAVYENNNNVWLDTTKSPWFANGELVGTVGIGRDISDIVPDDVKDAHTNPGSIEIAVDLMYNSEDIRGLTEHV